MKKIVIYITSILFTLILGIFIGKLFFNDKKDTVISNNVLSNKNYILNIEGSSYVKFNNISMNIDIKMKKKVITMLLMVLMH